jgi:hypothetical protein
MKGISGVVSVLAFVADLITIGLFVSQLFSGTSAISTTTAFAHIGWIIVLFLFAGGLFLYSRNEADALDKIAAVFAWCYIVLAGLVLALVSQTYVYEWHPSLAGLLGYAALVGFISGLGYSIAYTVGSRSRYFSVPFMLVALEQALFWILRIANYGLSLSWAFALNLLVFVFTGLLVLFFLRTDE